MNRLIAMLLLAAASMLPLVSHAKNGKNMIGVNVLLNTEVSDAVLKDLGSYGKVKDVLIEINALTLQAREGDLPLIQSLPYVAAANPDAERKAAPIDTVSAENFSGGLVPWDLDVMNVADIFEFEDGEGGTYLAPMRTTGGFDGDGVYVAVLDTGLVDVWRQYFPEERIAVEYARSFGGGGSPGAATPSQPNKWEHDQNSHGTHVTSSVLGYSLRGTPINGVAPMAKVIPVKVLNQNGSGWSSVIARGIVYIADLKKGPLAEHPVVINMSLGGSVLDAVEKAALDYAIDAGVKIVASAGNSGMLGMGYPGAYEPVISVAASGWAGEWTSQSWWLNLDDPDPNQPELYYITDFSSRELPGQDLDVAAPGSWIVGPYKLDSSNNTSYYYLGGTSMASPHVAGVVALMLQKNPGLSQAEVDGILTTTALPIPTEGDEPGDPAYIQVATPSGPATYTWGPDATGAGIVMADAAVAATPNPAP